MITVRTYETEDENIVEIRGHANYAPKGKDIVCAAITSLVSLADEMCKEYNGTSEISEGKAIFRFIKSDESESFIFCFINVIDEIAEEYGNYVQLLEGATDE